MCRRIPLDFACGCPGTCPCGAITLEQTEPCPLKRSSGACSFAPLAKKEVSLMPCAKCYDPIATFNVPVPGPIFREHAYCKPQAGPGPQPRPIPVSPTSRGIFPFPPGRGPGQMAVHPGLLGKQNQHSIPADRREQWPRPNYHPAVEAAVPATIRQGRVAGDPGVLGAQNE